MAEKESAKWSIPPELRAGAVAAVVNIVMDEKLDVKDRIAAFNSLLKAEEQNHKQKPDNSEEVDRLLREVEAELEARKKGET